MPEGKTVTELFGNGDKAWSLVPSTLISEQTGDLGVLELGKDFHFPAKRMFYLTRIDSEAERGHHAHRELQQAITCLSGSFNIELDNGIKKSSIKMIAGGDTLLLDGRVWRVMSDFKEHTVVAVLCDREYCYDEVIRDYSEFLRMAGDVNGL